MAKRKTNRIKAFETFLNPSIRRSRALWWLMFSSTLVVVFFWRATAIDWELSRFFTPTSSEFKRDCFTIVLSVWCSLIAAYIWTLSERSTEQRQEASALRDIRSVADLGCLAFVLAELEHYKGLTLKHHSMRVKLSPLTEDYFLVTIDYGYKRTLREFLDFRLDRVTESSDLSIIPSPVDQIRTSEIAWGFDESDMTTPPPIDSYLVSNLLIDSQPVRLSLTQERGGEARIFRAETPNSLLDGSDHAISFTLSFPVERESSLALTYDVPTLEPQVHFDYSSVHDKIVMWSLDKVGLVESPFQRHDDNGTIRYHHNGWALPKDAYIFAWWKKI